MWLESLQPSSPYLQSGRRCLMTRAYSTLVGAMASLMGFASLPGCGLIVVLWPPASEVVQLLHVPERVQVGRPFKIAADASVTCRYFQGIVVREDVPTKTLFIDALMKAEAFACGNEAVPGRFEGTARVTSSGTYTISYRGDYEGRKSLTLQAVSEAVPEWFPPPFDRSKL